jgi:hypothetical protein
MNRDAASVEPRRVLGGKNEHPHGVAPILKGGDEVAAEQAVAACDQELQVTPACSTTGDQWRRRYAKSAIWGSTCSSHAIT